MVEALRCVDGDTAREWLLGAIDAAAFDLGGVAPSHGADNNQGSERSFSAIMQADRSFEPVVRLIKMARQ